MQQAKKLLKKATATPKNRWISLLVFLVLCSLVIGGISYWNVTKKSIIKNEIDNSLEKKTKGLYVINYDKFNLDEVAGSLNVSNIHLVFDSLVYKDFLDRKEAPSILVDIRIPTLNVWGVQTPRALIDKEVVGQRVEIINPLIEIIYTGMNKDSAPQIPPQQLFRQLLANLNKILVKEIVVSNALIFTHQWNNPDSIITARDVSLRLADFALEDKSPGDSARFLFSKEIMLTAGKIDWMNDRKLYRYEANNMEMSSKDKTILCGKLSIDPLLGEEAFANKVKTQVDRIDLVLDRLQVRNLDFMKLFHGVVEADSLLISKAALKVYKDFGQPRDHVNRVGTFPHQMLMKLPISINIRKAVVSNGFVEYKQYTPKTGQKGKVQFYAVSAVINNITNQPAAIRSNNICRADTRSIFMNSARVKATFFFNLASNNGSFTIDGHIGGLDAKRLNSISQPLASAKIVKGTINGVDLHIKGSDYKGEAEITFLYTHLKIAVLEKNEEDGTLDKKKLVSMAANILIKNSNPGNNEKVRIGNGTFERDTNRSFFNLVWKTTFVALSETLGVPVKDKSKKL